MKPRPLSPKTISLVGASLTGLGFALALLGPPWIVFGLELPPSPHPAIIPCLLIAICHLGGGALAMVGWPLGRGRRQDPR